MNFTIKNIKLCIRRGKLLKGGALSGPIIFYIFNLIFARGFTKQIVRSKKNLLKIKSNIIDFYIAKSLFMFGNYSDSITILESLDKRVDDIEVTYLLAECHNKNNDKIIAWDILKKSIAQSSRLKVWLLLANLVESQTEFDELYKIWNEKILEGKIPKHHLDVNSYIATAALRSRNYDIAIQIWLELYTRAKERKIALPSVKNKRLISCSANEALLDLKSTLNNDNIVFFLISGTLLGCVRENQLLGHDKDIDVGVWDDFDYDHIANVFLKSGCFEVQAMRSEHCVRVKHLNGVAIDVFIHYREKRNYWHAGVKLMWNNSPFSLIERRFLNSNFFIPENYDLYLTENYGEWRTPKLDFDSTFDTPNASIINTNEIMVHIYRSLCLAYLKGDEVKIRKLEKLLEQPSNLMQIK